MVSPSGNTCEHAPGSVGHDIPEGVLVTVPLPPPASVTVSVDIVPVASSRANACGAVTPPPSHATIGVNDGSGPTASAGASPWTSGPLTPVPDAEPVVTSTNPVVPLKRRTYTDAAPVGPIVCHATSGRSDSPIASTGSSFRPLVGLITVDVDVLVPIIAHTAVAMLNVRTSCENFR